MKSIFTFIALIIFQLSSIAQTSVSGNQSGTWTKTNSPYLVTGEIIVPAGQTLSIEAGVEVNFQGSYKFTINGTLTAVGAESDSIVFTTGDIPTGWRGIRFMESQTGSSLTYCKIENGKVSGGDFPDLHGGGVLIYNSDVVIDHCAFENNRVPGASGGAIYAYNTTSATQITNCTFTNNSAYIEGGALKFFGDTGAGVENCKFFNNVVQYAGGAIYLYSCNNTQFDHCVFAGNGTTYDGGGAVAIESFSAGVVFKNCTFSANQAMNGDGGGIYSVYSDVSFINSIIYNNPGAYSDDLYITGGTVNVDYCDLTMPDGATGNNNIEADPKFADPTHGDYSLKYDSPCIDAGTGDYVYDEETNHDFGWRLDMGAIEYDGVRVLKNVNSTGEILFGGKVRAKIEVTDLGTLSQIDIIVHENEFYPNWGEGIVKRWFEISSVGDGFTFNITLSYKDSELNGEHEEILAMFRWDGAGWHGPLWSSSSNMNENWLTVDGQTEFGDWIIDDDWLPVEMTFFTASVIGETVELRWQTATETNNMGFQVQRAFLSQTGETTWRTIGFVEGNGTTAERHDYSYTDGNVQSGKYNYRLKQIDDDGSFEYSDVIEIAVGLPVKFKLSQNYPNPFGKASRAGNSITTIKYSLPEKSAVRIEVFNSLGESVALLTNSEKSAGNHETKWNAEDLPSGVYIISLSAEGFDSKTIFAQNKKALFLK